MTNKYNHYCKDVKKLDTIDIYTILKLYEVKSHAVGQAIKKLLVAGKRGGKGYEQDLQEAIDAIKRAIEMGAEENEAIGKSMPDECTLCGNMSKQSKYKGEGWFFCGQADKACKIENNQCTNFTPL